MLSSILKASLVTSSTLPSLGQFYEGGYYIGSVSVESSTYGVILSPKTLGNTSSTLQWKTSQTSTAGTSSFTDGFSNSNNMNDSSHPAAMFALDLTINSYSDWYLPSKDELNLIWVNRSYLGPLERNDSTLYWASTEYSSTNAYVQNFSNASSFNIAKDIGYSAKARAVRRFLIA